MYRLEGWSWSSYETIYLRDYPIAKKNNIEVLLCSIFLGSGSFYCLKFFTEKNFTLIKYLPCNNITELDLCKSVLINNGYKMNWNNYQLILSSYVEYFKKYSSYFKTDLDFIKHKDFKNFAYIR